jgi:prepilin-type N-terminal cleavage/methylation domain-containing protein
VNVSINFINKKAFTLAEVLITLAIIGVVAALTIPAVVKNYQKTQVLTQLKKVYSALSNTTNLAIADEGPVAGWKLGQDSSGEAASDFANTYLIPYLKVSKNCGTATSDDCTFKYITKNNAEATLGTKYSKFFLNDGTFIALSIENNQTAPAFTVTTIIDLNGQKKPNLLGRDVFSYRYIILHRDYPNETGKFIPNCFSNKNFNRDTLVNNTTYGCNVTGFCCAALIMVDNWQIKDDYKW